MVVFRAQEEVNKENCDGSAGDDHDAVAEEEEAKHVVDFSKPHVVHDKVELDENRAEGEDANKEHGRNRAEVGC